MHRGIVRSLLGIGSVLLMTAVVGAAQSSTAVAGAPCDRFASPTGSDTGDGTAADPLRTAQALVDALDPGQTGCLRSGTFSGDAQVKVRTPNVTLTSYPGERATLRGQLRLEVGATGAVVEGLVLDGRNPRNLLGPLVYADRAVLRNNDISNGHTAICVHVDRYYNGPAPQGVVIEDNRIHDCGVLPAANHHHGIYLAQSRGAVIRDNWIYDNADRGIQLYPNADGTTITGNVIDGNGQGIIFGSSRSDSPDGNVVEENIVANSTIRYNVESHSQGAPYGQGNVVRRNCVHGGVRDSGDGGIQSPERGFAASDNRLVDPRYVDRAAKNFDLRADSPCRSLLGDSGEAPAAPDGSSGGSPGGTGGSTDSGGDSGGTGGSDPSGQVPPRSSPPGRLTLRPDRRIVPRGRPVRLQGQAPRGASQIRLLRRHAGAWKPVRLLPVSRNGYVAWGLVNRRQVRFKTQTAEGASSRVVTIRAQSRD